MIKTQKEQNISDKNIRNLTITKTNSSYMFKDDKNHTVSKLNYHDYNIKDFDWILLSDIVTNPDYRRMGLASKLLDMIYTDMKKEKPNKGLYLFVKKDNYDAIRLYQKLNFNRIRNYKLKDGWYIIMAKGKADTDQFTNRNFS